MVGWLIHMRWMIFAKYVLLIISIILGAFAAVGLAYNCCETLELLDAQDVLPAVSAPAENSLPFPCTVEGTELVALSLISYEGTFLEDGGDSEVVGVAALMLRNNADKHICDAQIKVKQGERILVFELTHLPGNEEILVIEKNKQSFLGDVISGCEGTSRSAEHNGWTERFLLSPAGQRGLILKNLTEGKLEDIVVYYKTYYAPAGFYVGGITHSVRIGTISQKEEVQLLPYPFVSEGSAVVWVTQAMG